MASTKVQRMEIVKEVLSGDTLVVRGKPDRGPPKETTIHLAYVTAPRLARRPGPNKPEEKDEPFAWQSREALRKMVVGTTIEYTVEYTVNTIRHDFVTVRTADGKNLAEELVAQGWLKTRIQGGGNLSEEEEILRRLEQAATAAGHGMWTKDPAKLEKAVRTPMWNVENDHSLVVLKKKYNAIVEQVRDGGTLRLFLMPDFKYITVQLSGIKCPGFKRGEDRVDEPYAEEAKFFVESRLLQRDVKLYIEGISNQVYLGTVLHPRGNIAEALLKEGMARIVGWSLHCVTEGKEKYIEAEKVAKERKLRIAKDYVASVEGEGVKEYYAKVVEVVNPETIVVKADTGPARRLTLASIRGPKPKENVKPKSPYDVPYLFEAKEYLCRMLVGRRVHITVDFVRPPQDGFPERTGVTVVVDKVNVARELVAKGLCTVLRHRADDEQRSSHFSELQAAEQKAINSKLGLHSDKEPPSRRVNDISSNKEKAKNYLPFLQRVSRLKAMVDYVVHGSRLRLYIPKDLVLITLVLAGVDVPRTGRQDRDGAQSKPFAEEATQFTKDLCMQREVEIQVDGQDRVGNFIGTLWIDGTNLCVALVENGLAAVHFTADKLSYASSLYSAEEKAKAARLNIWKDHAEEPKETVEEVKERAVNYIEAIVSEVVDGRTLYVQAMDKAVQLEQLQAQLNKYYEDNPPISGTASVKPGEIVASKFNADNRWYRAKIVDVEATDVSVFFIDYGNTDKVLPRDVASLHTEFSLTAKPAAATEVQLALIELPDDEEWLEEAAVFLRDGLLEKKVRYNQEYTDGSRKCVSVLDAEGNDVAKTVLAAGLATVERRRERHLAPLISEYTAAMDIARLEHRNIWQYGDFEVEDAREFGFDRKKEEEKRPGKK